MVTILDTALRKTTAVALSGLRRCTVVLGGVTGRSRLPFRQSRGHAFANLLYLALDIPPVAGKRGGRFASVAQIPAMILELLRNRVIAQPFEYFRFDPGNKPFE
jgi:hypothetical protein